MRTLCAMNNVGVKSEVSKIGGGWLVAVFEGEEDGGGEEGMGFADFAFEEAFVGPVELLEVGAVDDEPGRGGVGLGDVAKFGSGVSQSGGGVGEDGVV